MDGVDYFENGDPEGDFAMMWARMPFRCHGGMRCSRHTCEVRSMLTWNSYTGSTTRACLSADGSPQWYRTSPGLQTAWATCSWSATMIRSRRQMATLVVWEAHLDVQYFTFQYASTRQPIESANIYKQEKGHPMPHNTW